MMHRAIAFFAPKSIYVVVAGQETCYDCCVVEVASKQMCCKKISGSLMLILMVGERQGW